LFFGFVNKGKDKEKGREKKGKKRIACGSSYVFILGVVVVGK